MLERSYYIETSVWGMIPPGQPREMRRATLRFLRQVPSGCCYVSEVVLREIAACVDSDRAQILRTYESIQPTVLEVSEEVKELAQFYLDLGILPKKKTEDALHVAITTVEELDFLVSWNYRHLVNLRKAEQFGGANLVRGFWKTPLIRTPLEVCDE